MIITMDTTERRQIRMFPLLHLLKASQNIRYRIHLGPLIIRNSHGLLLGFVDEEGERKI